MEWLVKNSDFLSGILQDTLSAIISTVIIAVVAYCFRGTITRVFKWKELLPSSKIPKIEVMLDASLGQDETGLIWGIISIVNNGDNSFSRIRLYKYYRTDEQLDLLYIEPLKTRVNYKASDNEEGERLTLMYKDLVRQFPESVNYPGLYLEIVDEHGIIFCMNIHLKSECLELYNESRFVGEPQNIKRLKKALPHKKIKGKTSKLESKYGIDINLG